MTERAFDLVEPPAVATTTDQIFESLYQAVVTLKLPPGAKVSEADVARQLGVSRQPVRDAFFRLSTLGFLSIRPQRATLITKISRAAVLQAAFIRTALEVACLGEAIAALTAEGLAELEALLLRQADAAAGGRRSEFHALDDLFHRRLCEIAGHGYAWTLIQEQKAHMDRVRYLSLTSGAQIAYDEHRLILDALTARDAPLAERRLRAHLGRIRSFLDEIVAEQGQYFDGAGGGAQSGQ